MIKPNSSNRYYIILDDNVKMTEVRDCAETIRQIVAPETIVKPFPSFQMILLENSEDIEEVKKLPFVINIEKSSLNNDSE